MLCLKAQNKNILFSVSLLGLFAIQTQLLGHSISTVNEVSVAVAGLTLWPSNAKAWSSVPSSTSGLHAGLAQPTRMSPPVTASNSKYHFPVFTAYVRSTRKKRILSMLNLSTAWPVGRWKGEEHSTTIQKANELTLSFHLVIKKKTFYMDTIVQLLIQLVL